MKIISSVILFALALLILGCSSVTVKTDYDREYDFSEFKTYRWASAQEINPDDELARNPLVQKRVMEAVDRTLAAKGMQKVESEDVDVVVLAHAGSKEKMQVTQTGGGYYRGWYDPWWGSYGGQTHVSYYEEATLVVDIVSWESKELAWRGMATGTVKEHKDAERNRKWLAIVVNIPDRQCSVFRRINDHGIESFISSSALSN
jgi:hypothetical protein